MFLVTRFTNWGSDIICSLFETKEKAEEYTNSLDSRVYKFSINEIFPNGAEIFIGNVEVECYGDANINFIFN